MCWCASRAQQQTPPCREVGVQGASRRLCPAGQEASREWGRNPRLTEGTGPAGWRWGGDHPESLQEPGDTKRPQTIHQPWDARSSSSRPPVAAARVETLQETRGLGMRRGKPAAEPARGAGVTGEVWSVQGAKRGSQRVPGAARCGGTAVPAATTPVSPGIPETGGSPRVRDKISWVDPVSVLRVDSSRWERFVQIWWHSCGAPCVCVWLKSLGRRTRKREVFPARCRSRSPRDLGGAMPSRESPIPPIPAIPFPAARSAGRFPYASVYLCLRNTAPGANWRELTCYQY